MIPPNILAKKILSTCPELNISEVQLIADITEIMSEYKPFKQQYGVITHTIDCDKEIAEHNKCSFCGNIGAYYHGYKRVTHPYNYLAYLECKFCHHTEEF